MEDETDPITTWTTTYSMTFVFITDIDFTSEGKRLSRVDFKTKVSTTNLTWYIICQLNSTCWLIIGSSSTFLEETFKVFFGYDSTSKVSFIHWTCCTFSSRTSISYFRSSWRFCSFWRWCFSCYFSNFLHTCHCLIQAFNTLVDLFLACWTVCNQCFCFSNCSCYFSFNRSFLTIQVFSFSLRQSNL